MTHTVVVIGAVLWFITACAGLALVRYGVGQVLLAIAVGAGSVVGFTTAILHGIEPDLRRARHCIDRGGVYIDARDGRTFCVAKSALLSP